MYKLDRNWLDYFEFTKKRWEVFSHKKDSLRPAKLKNYEKNYGKMYLYWYALQILVLSCCFWPELSEASTTDWPSDTPRWLAKTWFWRNLLTTKLGTFEKYAYSYKVRIIRVKDVQVEIG